MDDFFRKIVLKASGAEGIEREELIQNLWSNYGEIYRYYLAGSRRQSVVVKHVRLPDTGYHPRGWNTNLSHERKIRSYEIEMAWYTDYSSHCDDFCPVPRCLALKNRGEEVLMVLEDLNEVGFSVRKTTVSLNDMKACLSWLASFHITYLGVKPKNLWPEGAYWHLETRPDELKALEHKELKEMAPVIENLLKSSPWQTLIHGDAKLANFCFSASENRVAAVDFQYVGGGCGMKDVAYFIGSCLYENECDEYEEILLNHYFREIRSAVKRKKTDVDVDVDALEENWRELYPVAWTDFHRFLKGWSPGHWKINSYSERMTRRVLNRLRGEK